MSDIHFDRIFEQQFSGVIYLLHLTVDGNALSIDLEDKGSGDIWTGHYSAEKIEENTQKTTSFKKFEVFVQMLTEAITNPNECVWVDLLTYHDLQLLKNRKNYMKGINTNSNNKRYLVLNYLTAYDKVHYPIHLNFEEIPNANRLKLSIRRLRSQLDMYRKGTTSNTDELVKDISYFKQQNDLLKTKVRKLEESQINNSQVMQQSQVRQLVKDQKLSNQSSHLKQVMAQSQQEIKLYKTRYEQKQKENKQLKAELAQLLKDMARTDELHNKEKQTISKKVYQELNLKLTQLTKQTTNLVSELNFAREQEKKSKLRIGQLQKQMESLLKRNSTTQNLHSKRSTTPNSQKKSERKPDQTKRNSIRKKSVVDSDTESSRMRKMNNNKVSPFRNSKVMQSPSRNDRSRSRSKERITTENKAKSRKSVSPPSNIMTESEQNIDPNFASDSDSETNQISQTMAMLRKKREQALRFKDKKPQKDEKSVVMQSDIEKKIGHIADILRKSRKQ